MKQPFTYYGGKQNMVKHILPLLPAHRIYVEPFAGGASVFWAKPTVDHRDYIEVLNDLNDDIITTYRVIQDKGQYDKLVNMLKGTLYSRSDYKRAQVLLKDKCADNVERAWAFIVRQQMSFGHVGYSSGWGYDRNGACTKPPLTWQNKLKEFTAQYTERLKDTYLDCDNALKVIKRWDDPEALFYVDPPYPNTDQGQYSHKYSQDDFIELIEVLKTIKGSFILSCYPNASVPDDWQCVEFDMQLSASKDNKGKRKTEKLWIVDKSTSNINNSQYQFFN